MNDFGFRLWSDLRERRLLPVAFLLLVGLIAVPLVLKKSAEKPPPPPATVAQPPSAPELEEIKGLASVKLAETGVESGSSLDTFDSSDPFRPPQRVIDGAEEEIGEGISPPGGITLSEETVETGSGGADPSAGTGGDTGGGGTGGGDTGGDTGPNTGGGDDGPSTETTEFAYVIDVTFTNNGRTRKIKGMQRLDLLPSEASPLLLFLGVSSNAGNAVFLVDATLTPAGEGRCEPSADECALLYLGPGSEHMFTNEDGDSYELRIDQIRKVKMQSRASARASSARAPKGRRRVSRPMLADLLSVSRRTADDSTGHRGRR